MSALIDQICARVDQGADATESDRAAAVRAFEDTIAVMLAGWSEPVSLAARRYGAGSGVALFPGDRAASAEQAAFIQAVAGHALDYDDVHLVSTTHPSVVIVPALMALASRRRSDRTMTDAYGVGVSVNIAVGRVLGFEHYARGWHATSTIGPIAAAAAGCHLLGLAERTTRSAISLAAAQSAGLQRNFGSMAKPVQAGNAAAAAVRAVLLAADGVTGEADIFGEKGVSALYGGDSMPMQPLRAADVHSVSVKLYPCCYATHRIISAAFEVRDKLSQAERIVLRVPPETMRPLRIVDPKTGAEAQFCAAYVLAVALLYGAVRLSDFVDAAVHRSDVRTLMKRIQVEVEAGAGRATGGLDAGEVTLQLHGPGSLLAQATCAHFPGSPQAPASPAQFAAKIDDCLAAAGGLSRDDFRARVADLTGRAAARKAAE